MNILSYLNQDILYGQYNTFAHPRYNNISWSCSDGSGDLETYMNHGVESIQWYFHNDRSNNLQIFHEFIDSHSDVPCIYTYFQYHFLLIYL